MIDKNKSLYDQKRDTVGKIYRDAQINNKEDFIEVGDMARELTTSLVEDINEALANFDRKEPKKPYYLMVEEKRDLQMKNAIARRLHYFGYRPWPEDNTTVFWKNPKTQELRFCWCLPHWAEMDTTLMNAHTFEDEYIYRIQCWKKFDLSPFGFVEDGKEGWIPNSKWKDKKIEDKPRSRILEL